MPDSYLARGQGVSLAPGEWVIRGRLNVGASGAVSSTKGKGFSIARSAAGHYIITLKRSYKALIGARGDMLYAAFGSIDKLRVAFANDAVTASKTVKMLIVPGDSTTLTDPTSGDSVTFELVLSNSRLNA